MEGLILSLLLIIIGITGGYLLNQAVEKNIITLPLKIAQLRILLQKLGLLVFMPVSFLGAVWVVSLEDGRVMFLPFIGITVLLTGGILGLLAASVLKMEKKQKGVMYCCGSFTNIGAIGGLVCYMFLGEAGFALVALYKMFEEMSYYIIGFPVARYYGGSTSEQAGIFKRAANVFKDPFVATILSAFFIGLFLNLMGVSRPQFFAEITAFSVPIGTFVLIFSIGLGMRFSRVTDHVVQCIALAGTKFLFLPLLGCLLAYSFGLHNVGDGLPFKVVLILSSMPVAFNALVAASIFDLDLDLANSLWLITTVLLVAILPLQYFLLTFF